VLSDIDTLLFTPIDTSHAYRLSELALRVSELRGSGEGWATAL
jgi:hypothetical protein